jgi:hypothetical protein
MATPPLSKARMTTRRRRSSQHGSGTTARALSRATTPPAAPADFAFTQDPLSGSITLHVQSSAVQAMPGGTAADVASMRSRIACARPEYEAGQISIFKGAPTSWSELEAPPVPIADKATGALIVRAPEPTAVH